MRGRTRLLLFSKGYFVYKLLIVNIFDLHVDPVCFRICLVLPDSESLTAFRGTLVDDVELDRRMLLEEVAEHEFSLRLAVGLGAVVECNVNGLIEIAGEFFRASCLNCFLDLGDNVALRK